MPAFATERNAMIAAKAMIYAPMLEPVIVAATVETGVKFIFPSPQKIKVIKKND